MLVLQTPAVIKRQDLRLLTYLTWQFWFIRFSSLPKERELDPLQLIQQVLDYYYISICMHYFYAKRQLYKYLLKSIMQKVEALSKVNLSYESNCPICYEEFNSEDKRPYIICINQHISCKKCLDEYLQKHRNSRKLFRTSKLSCPFCKQQFFEDKQLRPLLSLIQKAKKQKYRNQILIYKINNINEIVKVMTTIFISKIQEFDKNNAVKVEQIKEQIRITLQIRNKQILEQTKNFVSENTKQEQENKQLIQKMLKGNKEGRQNQDYIFGIPKADAEEDTKKYILSQKVTIFSFLIILVCVVAQINYINLNALENIQNSLESNFTKFNKYLTSNEGCKTNNKMEYNSKQQDSDLLKNIYQKLEQIKLSPIEKCFDTLKDPASIIIPEKSGPVKQIIIKKKKQDDFHIFLIIWALSPFYFMWQCCCKRD